MKKVSAIITTYNSADYIKNTIESIINQRGSGELFQLELIVVDDCSTDDTREILKEFNLILIKTETNSGGPNRGRNIGLEAATGDFICISDHDDEWIEDRIITLLPYLEKAPIVTSGYKTIDAKNHKVTTKTLRSESPFFLFHRNKTFLTILKRSLKGQNTYLSSIIFQKSLKHILFEEHFGVVDFDWLLRLFHQQESIEVREPLYIRHKDGENLSLDNKYRITDAYFSLMFIHKNYYDTYCRATKIAHRKIFGTMARYYYFIGEMGKARFYLKKSGLSWKTIAYFLTSFAGSGLVRKYFHIYD